MELLIVLGVSLAAAGFAAAALAPMVAGARAEGAARYLAATLQRERLEAVRTGRVGGLRFRTDATDGAHLRARRGRQRQRPADRGAGRRCRSRPRRADARERRLRRRPVRDRRHGAGHRRSPRSPPAATRSASAACCSRSRRTAARPGDALPRERGSPAVRGPRARGTGHVRVYELDRATTRWVTDEPAEDRRAARRWDPRDLPWPVSCRVARATRW